MSAPTSSSTTGPDGVFTAPLVVAYPYKRTVGTLLSRFFQSLQEGRLEGTKGSDGRVYFPPAEFDPVTGRQLDEWVTLAETGTVVTWAWQSVPQPDQPLERPFAWAMVTLDGADVPMLHAVDAGEMARMRSGARVKVRWADERSGGIRDIACFDLLEGAS
ncbi:MAG: Zn-ribbon domain-containing OB-fold protein [Acidimicrobiia bacterium]